MYCKTIIWSLGFLSLMNCNAQKDSQTSTKNLETTATESIPRSKNSEVIYFNQGENKFLKEYEMNVTFKGISEDSRCPKEVTCVWGGVAVADVEVMGLATRPVVLHLATTENAGRNHFQSADFNGYTISLTEVNPYPTSQKSAKTMLGNYKIGITIKKTGEKPTMR